MIRRLALVLAASAAVSFLAGCATTGGGSLSDTPQTRERAARIAAEPRGDYFVGRRYYVATTRFWGYLRRPGQSWQEARLVVMDPRGVKAPDFLPEEPTDGGAAHGFDNNFEYHITGSFTGRKIYDPNSDLFLPEFRPRNFKLIDPVPGFLFDPTERYAPNAVTLIPSRGLGQ